MPTNRIIPKTNAITGSSTAPSAAALVTGEVASNKFTGDLFILKEDATVEQIGSDASKLSKGTVPAARLPVLTGDVTTSAGSTATSVVRLRGRNISTTAPIQGQAYVYNGTSGQWEPQTVSSGTPTAAAMVHNNGPYSFRNRIINPDFRIDQRNSGAAVTLTASMQYTLDRWAVQTVETPSGTTTAQQVSNFPTGPYNTAQGNALKLTRSTTGTNKWRIAQVVESINCSDIAGARMVLTVAYRSTNLTGATGTVKVVFGTGVDEGLAGAVAGTWTGYSAVLTQTMDSSFDNGLTVSQFSYSFLPPTNFKEMAVIIETNACSTVGGSFELGAVQLEVGQVETPFEERPIQVERGLCQRYFQRISDIYIEGYCSVGNTRVSSPFPLAVAMRTTPARTVVTTGTKTNIRGDSTTYCGLTPRSATMATAFVEAAAAGLAAVIGQVETLSAEL